MINRRKGMLITSGLIRDVTQVKSKYFLCIIFSLWVDRKKVNHILLSVESEVNIELKEI